MIKKHIKFWLPILIIIILYFAIRLVNLTILPIFTDEAIYIRWGQIGLRDASHRFLSLEDGKQPLFVWLMYPMLKLFADPLVAGRMVSIVAGFFNLIGMMILAKIIFGRKAIIPAGLLYLISPFFLFYDRLALYDSLTACFAIWALILEILLVTTLRLDVALLLGFVIGGGLLTKSSAQFSLYLFPASLILFDFKSKNKIHRLIKWLALALIATVISLCFSLVIKLSPLQHMVGQKNLTFILSFTDFFKDPFSRLIGNLRGLVDWLVGYFTWPWIIGIGVSLIISLKKYFTQTLLLILWWLFPFLALAAFGIVLYPRFILFMVFPLLIILAAGLVSIKEKITHPVLFILGFLLLSFYPGYISSQLLFNPLNAPIPKTDRMQFIDDWPSGYGIKEIVEFAQREAQKEPIFIGTEGTFGLTPYALTIYLQNTPNIEIKGYWPINEGMAEIIQIAKHKTTYVLFKDTQEPNPEWPLELVVQYRKGRSNIYSKLYQVINLTK